MKLFYTFIALITIIIPLLFFAVSGKNRRVTYRYFIAQKQMSLALRDILAG